MASRGDEVEKRMHSVVPETRIPLDSRFFSKNIIVLALEISNDLAKRSLVIDLISKTGGVDDSK